MQTAQPHGSFLEGARPQASDAKPGPEAKPGPKKRSGRKTQPSAVADGAQPQPGLDDKKKPNYNKKAGSKITQLSSKVTEIRCLQTNVQSSQTLFLVNWVQQISYELRVWECTYDGKHEGI